MKLENMGDLGIPAAIVAPAITAGSGFFSKLFGGGGGEINYANNFSAQVGIGKKFLQTEANAYYARSTALGISAFDIARKEFNAGRRLSDDELLVSVGKTPRNPASLLPGVLNPGSNFPWAIVIGGGIAVLGIGAALLMSKKR